MASDLLTAMLTGNNGASALVADPAMASVIPQLTLAQAMTQQGLSGAPAYPAQAIGRLAQTLAGSKMMDEATGELSHVYGRAAGSMAKIFPEDTPLGRGLRSDDPYVRVQAMQMASKAMLLNSERQKLSPGEGVYTAPGTNPVMANTGGAAAAVETAKNPPLIARAGGEAAAKAPYEAGGTATIKGGPSGVQEVPITAQTRARMQPGGDLGPLNQPPATPKPPIVVKPSGVRRAPGLFSSSAEPPPASPPAATAPRGMAGPGSFEAAWGDRVAGPTGFGGKPVATPEYEGRIEAEKDTNKEFVEKSAQNYEAAQNLMGRLTTMDHNIDALGPRWMGAGANAKGEFGKAWNSMLDSAGIQGHHIDPNKIATWEEFNKESTRAGMELIKSNFGGSREAASIIQMGAGAVPSAQQSYLGAKYNAASIKAATQRQIDLHEYKTQLLSQGKSLIGADAAFNKVRPPEQYAMKGITDVIPAPAKQYLAAHPETAAHFDKQFGTGTAEFLLGGK